MRCTRCNERAEKGLKLICIEGLLFCKECIKKIVKESHIKALESVNFTHKEPVGSTQEVA